MITGDLKNKIDNLWEVFWTGGLTNPLDVVEQLTYLFFMRDLDDLDNSNKKDCEFFEQPFHSMFPTEVTLSNGEKLSGELLKWSVFKTESNPDRLFDIVSLGVFPFIKSLSVNENTSFAKNMENAKKFLDYMTSFDTQKKMNDELNARAVRKDLGSSPILVDIKNINAITSNEELEYIDNFVKENQEAWLEKFKNIITDKL